MMSPTIKTMLFGLIGSQIDEDMDPMVSRVAEMSIYVANGKYNLQQQNNLKSRRTIYIALELGKHKLKCIC